MLITVMKLFDYYFMPFPARGVVLEWNGVTKDTLLTHPRYRKQGFIMIGGGIVAANYHPQRRD
jgi:hypothetical protein